MNKKITIALLSAIILAGWGCSKLLPQEPAVEDVLPAPIEGLSGAQLRAHILGDEEFAHIYSVEEGLGPIFVQSSCEGCHVADGKGHPENIVTRFGRMNGGLVDNLLKQGGPQLQPKSIANYDPERIPSKANAVSLRLPPMVTGLGFLAAVHDSTLLSMSDPFDSDGDGISGRVNYVQPTDFFEAKDIHIDSSGYYIGRFGKKAKEVRIIDQVVFALKEDIGITSDFDPVDVSNYSVGAHSGDEVADPEVSSSVVQNLVFYLRTLETPPRRNVDDPDVLAGEQQFLNLGCDGCHKPTLKTVKSDIDALSEKEFHPYTDLLLHQMGSVLADDLKEGNANGYEWRTQPLWGLGLAEQSQGGAGYYLHDGRATTLEEAILLHMGGEAQEPALKFSQLSDVEKEQLYKFLNSL